jgi:hypothetical protein
MIPLLPVVAAVNIFIVAPGYAAVHSTKTFQVTKPIAAAIFYQLI